MPGVEGGIALEAALVGQATGRPVRMQGMRHDGTGWDPNDLLQEAITRTLQGTRNCPTSVDVMKHLADTMSSIADTERSKGHNQNLHAPIVQPGLDLAEDPPSPT